MNESLAQQFSYDAHDKLTGGLNESESYDANGNLQTQTVSGQTTTYTWDDADRLVSQQFGDGHADSYTYTGLGMRLTKGDPTGSYSYLADGVSPASDVLSDGHTSFTPGISEQDPSGDRFYLADAQGNGRALLDGNQSATDGYNWDAFGSSVSRFGNNPTAYAWNGAAGYQSDGDSGLKLLGHRYYDSRTGRFISQDPAGDGDNWYAYADNDPMDEADPEGLISQSVNGGNASLGGPMAAAADLANFDDGFTFTVTEYTHNWFDVHNGSSAWVHEPGSDTYTPVGSTTFGFAGDSAADFWASFWKQVVHEYNTAGKFRGPPTNFAPRNDWAKISGIIRDASKGKGNFGLGPATKAEANAAGRAWIGKGYRVSKSGKAWVSQSGLRQYRPASFKPNMGRTQANLESRPTNSGEWQSNGHLDIVP